MALPTHGHTITPPTKPSENLAPTTKVAPDEGHPNAADKPWYERPAHAGAFEAEAAANKRRPDFRPSTKDD